MFMRTRTKALIILAGALQITSAIPGQIYRMDLFVLAPSGISTGGVYSISGTVGQVEAGGMMSGEAYSLTGGFWNSSSTVEEPAATKLTVQVTGPGVVVVSWPSPSTGLFLEQSSSLSFPDWTAASETVTDDGTTKSIVISPTATHRYYRLLRRDVPGGGN